MPLGRHSGTEFVMVSNGTFLGHFGVGDFGVGPNAANLKEISVLSSP